jgi:hypothetical protein
VTEIFKRGFSGVEILVGSEFVQPRCFSVVYRQAATTALVEAAEIELRIRVTLIGG